MHVPVVPLSVEQLLKRLLLLLQVVELRAPPRQHITVNQATVNVHKILIVLENGAHVMRIVVQPSVFQLDRVDKGQSVRQLLVLQGVVLQATVNVHKILIVLENGAHVMRIVVQLSLIHI